MKQKARKFEYENEIMFFFFCHAVAVLFVEGDAKQKADWRSFDMLFEKLLQTKGNANQDNKKVLLLLCDCD